MSTYQFTRQFSGNAGSKVTLDHYDVSNNSAKVNGKLVLTPQVHQWRHARMLEFLYHPDYAFAGVPGDASVPVYDMGSNEMAFLTNIALAKFTGKVRKHNANLGVTLAQWKKSKDTLIDRSHKLAFAFDKSLRIAEKQKRKPLTRREAIQLRAGDVLEYEFGWKPLVDDMTKALEALGRSPPNGWITACHKGVHTSTYVEPYGPFSAYRRILKEGEISCSISGCVEVESPNLHLLSQLGLLKLPAVAWDLIPWSYVVNMFTNMSQMVNSVTDFVGVTILSSCTTKTASIERSDYMVGDRWGGSPGSSRTLVHEKRRLRDLGLPSPKFQMRVPELNLELAVTMCSVILQRINKLNRLFGLYQR